MPSYWMTEEALLSFTSTIHGLLIFDLLDIDFLLLTLNLRVDGVDADGAGGLGAHL